MVFFYKMDRKSDNLTRIGLVFMVDTGGKLPYLFYSTMSRLLKVRPSIVMKESGLQRLILFFFKLRLIANI